MTTKDVIVAAAQVMGVAQGGESLSAEDTAALLTILNRLLDSWNAERSAVFHDAFATFPITPNLVPMTIGPTGATWTAAQRPVSIEAATLILSDNARIPIVVHSGPEGAAWWADVPTRSVTSDVPTDVYYDPGWPNGSLYFWPTPSAANSVEVLSRSVLGNLALTDAFTLPPGYLDAIVKTLCEEAAPVFRAVLPVTFAADAAKSRARVFRVNDPTPYIATADTGLGGEAPRSFNYLIGPFRH